MKAILVSEADEASTHVREHLLEFTEWDRRTDDERPDSEGGGEYHVTDDFEMRSFEDLHLYIDDAAEAYDCDPEFLAFASKHSGETGPLLTAHFTGNFGEAEYGGGDHALAEAAPAALDAVVSAFSDTAPEGYEVGVEATHHGPTEVGCPSLFVEVGSEQAQWRDPDAARAVARSILSLSDLPTREPGSDPERTIVGFGGGHYAPRFLRILLETPWRVGHVAADWALSEVDPRDHREVIAEAFEASGATRAVVDGDHPELRAVVDELGYEVVSETWVRAVGERPPGVVEEVEDRLASVDDGTRFGERSGSEGFEVVDLPEALLSEAQGIDPERTRDVLEGEAVAFETREGASRVDGRAAIPDPQAYDAVVDGLVAVLRGKYDAVERGEDAVVATETAFDPELAREAGVPEGPAFGKLSAGQSVTVDGESVDPGDVHRERTHRFEL
jgi:D-aminoacyl-tRNA deacylase